MDKVEFRPINTSDDGILYKIICDTLTEFNCNKPGTVFADPQTAYLSRIYSQPGYFYFVAELNNSVVGGAGFGPLPGLPDICELQKMYLLPEARKKSLGYQLLQRCMDAARKNGYTKMYLESLRELKPALKFYEKNGFAYLDAPLADTGHFSCDQWMIRDL